jgi:O-antigen/teichoic acid export membrane protein
MSTDATEKGSQEPGRAKAPDTSAAAAMGGGGRVALYIFGLRCGSAGVAYAMQIALARLLGDAQYGVFVTAWALVPLVGTFACLGLPLVAQKLVPTYLVSGNRVALAGFLHGARWVSGLSGAVLSLTGLALLFLSPILPFLDHIAEGPYWVPLLMVLLTAPLFAVGAVQEGIARSLDWTPTAMMPAYLLRPLVLLMFGSIAIWAGQPALAGTVMTAGMVATALTVAGQAKAIETGTRRAGLALQEGERRPTLTEWLGDRRWLKLGAPIVIVEVCDLVMLNADVLVLAVFVPPQDVGMYFAAAKTLMLVQFVYFAVASSMTHRFAALHEAGDETGLQDALRRSVHWTFWPSLAATGVMLAAGPYLLALFGPAFVTAYPVMAILSVGLLVRAGVGPLERFLNMIGHEWAAARAYGVATVFCIVFNIALIPTYGIRGAAVAMAATYAIETLLLVVATRAALRRRALPVDAR